MEAMAPPYLKPPIIEAVIEFRIAESLNIQAIEKAAKKLKKYYSQIAEESEMKVETQFNDGSVTQSHSSQKIGYRLTSSDGAEIAMVHRGRLLFSRLAPYPGWEEFVERVQRDWKIWRKSTNRVEINRIGVRFINRIDISVETQEMITPSMYLTVFPAFPSIGPNRLDTYHMQITKPLDEENLKMTINTASIASPIPRSKAILLDIDVYVSGSLPKNDEQMWRLIDEIREQKNSAFEACITDKARELFSA